MRSCSSKDDAAKPSVDDSLGMKLLPFVLSVIAGSVDVIGFLSLDGLLTAHITGNVVVAAAKLVAHDSAPISYLIAVPVFTACLVLVKVLAAGFDRTSSIHKAPNAH